ncbi:MAG TPA: DUF2249 domain-containing protein [Aggregicoccus sp.]|nr:DUF2249 domain-containing protein [Aggregicoccus sp.]
MEVLPRTLAAAGVTHARTLDVRPVLEKGGDPFSLIMKTVRELEPSEALHLVVNFEPRPLYAVLRSSFGREHVMEQVGELFHVWFYLPAPGAVASAPEDSAQGESGARAPLLPPVELDVRGMEPPGPMMAILEKLVELGPGAQLLVAHHREPVLLYDKLKLRGYAAHTTRRGEGDYLVHVAPAWALAPDAQP